MQLKRECFSILSVRTTKVFGERKIVVWDYYPLYNPGDGVSHYVRVAGIEEGDDVLCIRLERDNYADCFFRNSTETVDEFTARMDASLSAKYEEAILNILAKNELVDDDGRVNDVSMLTVYNDIVGIDKTNIFIGSSSEPNTDNLIAYIRTSDEEY